MSRELIIRSRATQDLRQQANYILRNGNVAAAEQFLEFTEATFDRILLTPRIGKQVDFILDSMGKARQWQIKNFHDYLVFYRVHENRIEISRILHGERNLAGILSTLDEEI